MSVNKLILVGRLGADPEVRYTQNDVAVATLSVATSEKYTDKTSGEVVEKTEWHRVTLWDKLAELAQTYLAKGSQVYLEGPIHTRKYEDKEGIERYTTEMKAQVMRFLGGKNENGAERQEPATKTAKRPAKAKAKPAPVIDEEDYDDDDLPF